jgi:nucleoside-diphosphate-sugar epimerase
LRILVTGSSGRIGAAIGARLALRHRVTGVDRRGGPMTTATVDIRDTTRIAALCRGIDAVVHTAALHVPDLASHGAAEFQSVNVDATRRLLEAIAPIRTRSACAPFGAFLSSSDPRST